MIKYESELMHHGIVGQRKGVRNGPPYPLDKKEHMQVISSSKKKKRVEAGKDPKEAKRVKKEQKKAWKVKVKEQKKFNKNMKKLQKKEKSRKKNEARVERQLRKRELEIRERENKFRKGNENVGKLTDAEIQERINRLNLESVYRQKLNEARGKQQVKKHDSFIKNAIKKSASTALTAAGTAALVYAGKSIVSRMLDPDMTDKEKKGFKKDLFKKSLNQYW